MRVDIIDVARDTYVESIPGLGAVAGALVSETRGPVFTSNRGENTVSGFAPHAERDAFEIGVGVKPNGLATWRDSDRVEEWVAELIQDKPVAVYCSYGFDVGCNVAKTLTEHGLNARFVRGGLSAWYASGGARALKRTAG